MSKTLKVQSIEGEDVEIQEIDLLDKVNMMRAVDAILSGNVVAGHMRRVYGFWIDSSKPRARKAVARIKGEPEDKKMSIMTTGSFIVPHIDVASVKKELRKFVQNPSTYSETFGSLCHTIVPIRPESVSIFSNSVISSSLSHEGKMNNFVYNLDPTGHPGMEAFITTLENEGVIPAVTSMNPATYPEITSSWDATKFLSTIPSNKPAIMLRDSHIVRDDILGSFTQVHLTDGVVQRDGHIPAYILGWMLGLEVDPSKLKKHKYPHGSFEQEFNDTIKKMNPAEIRSMLLNFIHPTK